MEVCVLPKVANFHENSLQDLELDCDIHGWTRVLLNQYTDKGGGQATAGGLQMLLHRRRRRQLLASSSATLFVAAEEDSPTGGLPDSVLLHILGCLSAFDLANCAQVCTRWCAVANDPLLWRSLLARESQRWLCCGHDCFPDALSDQGHSPKDIYIRCCPELDSARRRRRRELRYYLRGLPSRLLLSLVPRKFPRLAMIGTGLESSATGLLTRSLMSVEQLTPRLSVVSAFPGLNGLGAGFTYRLTGGLQLQHFHLSTLYSATRAEREAAAAQAAPRHSRLFQIGVDGSLELTTRVRELCLTLDGLIYVVDATDTPESAAALSAARAELYAAAQQLWAAPRLALLVLAVTREPDGRTAQKRLSCVDTARVLGLDKLEGAWRVAHCAAATLEGLPDAMDWLVETCQE